MDKILHGDSLDLLKDLDDNSVDSIVTDPPYGYDFMGKDWDKAVPSVEMWEECLRVLKPGSFAFIMSAPRADVQGEMIKRLEKAGFRVDFTPIYWTYATGFPKAANMGKLVDKRLGAEREVVGKKECGYQVSISKTRKEQGYRPNETNATTEVDITEPGSDEAKALNGSYGGYQPKPAVEVVIVAMKPLDKKGYLEQALDNGKGVTWFDDCRIPFDEGDTPQGGYGDMDIGIGKPAETQNYRKKDGNETRGWNNSRGYGRDSEPKTTKRKPREDGTVFKTSGFKSENNDTAEASPFGRFAANLVVSDDVLEEDFSRYYDLDAWWEDRVQKLPDEIKRTFPFLAVPKPSKSEKNMGLDKFDKQQKIFNGQSDKPSTDMKGVEQKFTTQPSANNHPTVKPTTLMSYLVTLGSRKGDVVLDPFAGSGTTGISCVFSERNYLLIEREKEYFDILKARIKKAENPAGIVQHEWF